MNEHLIQNAAEGPERYELEDEPAPISLPIRTDLFQLFGNGIVMLATPEPIGPETNTFDVWLHVGENDTVTVCTGKAEVGQNVRTSLAHAAADELPVSLTALQIVLGDTERTPFDIGTFGSRTTPLLVPQVRRAAAAAREWLLDTAAQRWQTNRDTLTIKSGCIIQDSPGRSVSFGQLVQGQRGVRTVGPEVALTPADRWTVAGQSVPKANARAFVTGQHRFTSDLFRDGMEYGKVLRPPAHQARLLSADTHIAEAMPGVTVARDGDFIGVVAPTPREAELALAAIVADWEMPNVPQGSDLLSLLRPDPTPFSAPVEGELQATYTIAYIAHVPLEPRAALAVWTGNQMTVWTGTQRPFGVREELSVAFGLHENQVRVIVPDTGSGYGGKHTGDAAVEAARLARAAAKPVKLAWTRQEEFTAAYLRPAGVIDICASVTLGGTLTKWECHNYNSGGTGIQSPYTIPDQVTEFHEARSPLRQGSYRALAATANHFARECHMDDLAHACGLDPLAFRLRNLADDRLKAVLTTAAEQFGWHGYTPKPGHGIGLAAGTEKGSVIANCVEICIDSLSGEVKILRLTAAYECGAIVNPAHLKSQVEGAIVMGIGGALYEAIQFDGGRILNPCLSEYRVPRFADVPEIDIILLNRTDLPSVGAGETPIVAIAPALGNALFDATGTRSRTLPLRS